MGVAVRITTPYFGDVPKTVMIVSTMPGPRSKGGAVVSPIKCTLRCSGQAQLSEHHVVSVEITGASKNGSGTGKVQSLSSTKKQSAPTGPLFI